MTRPDFVVLSVEAPEGERFAIVRPRDFNWSVTLEDFNRELELLAEDTVRARLAEMGLGNDAVASHITRARKSRRLNRGGSWDRVTTVGYRNEEGQEVVARTNRTGSEPDQRVFEMRCSVCGHRYGSNGCDIPRRCCPSCQDGPPGEAFR